MKISNLQDVSNGHVGCQRVLEVANGFVREVVVGRDASKRGGVDR